MLASPRETVLCRYRYDALDRQADCTLFEEPGIQRFYCRTRLATEIQGAVQCSIFQHDDQLLAQQQSPSGKADTSLLATDQQRSVLNALDATQPHPLAYTPYGHPSPANGLLSLLGFNGEPPDPVTGHYHLGNGYRQLNPVLMRFNSPDSWSPFGKGGLNPYVYCLGDPMNRVDWTGNSSFLIRIYKGFKNRIGIRTPGKSKKTASGSTPSTVLASTTSTDSIALTGKAKSRGAQYSERSTAASTEALTGDTSDLDMLRRLHALKGNHSPSMSSHPRTPNILNNPPSATPSAFANSAKHASYDELLQQKEAISAWSATGTERDQMLTIITQEQINRFPHFYDKPPISNREIRLGEPGYR